MRLRPLRLGLLLLREVDASGSVRPSDAAPRTRFTTLQPRYCPRLGHRAFYWRTDFEVLTSLDLEAAYSLSFWRCVSVAQSRSSLVLTAESLSHSLAEVSFWRGKGDESAAPDLPDASEEDADYVDGASSSAGSDASQEEGEDVADGDQAATKSDGGVDAPAEERRDGNAALAQVAPRGERREAADDRIADGNAALAQAAPRGELLARRQAAARGNAFRVRPWCRAPCRWP